MGTGPLIPTDVGACTGTTSPYGAFDMGGNVFQWNEAVLYDPATSRGIRGGSYAGTELDFISTTRYSADPKTDIFRNMGFRLASSDPDVIAMPPLPPPVPVPAVSATISVKMSGGKGLITSNTGVVDCGRTCSASVLPGSVITLTATADAGFRFVNWTGACTGAAPICGLSVTGKVQAQANFTKVFQSGPQGQGREQENGGP